MSSMRIGSSNRRNGIRPTSSTGRGAGFFISDGKPIELEEAVALKTLLLGNANKLYPEGWVGQAFTFRQDGPLNFGLVQKKGGPCGVLAVVQAFILKHLLFPNQELANTPMGLSPTQDMCQNALISTLVHILQKVSSNTKFL